jgi:hypothetical protein
VRGAIQKENSRADTLPDDREAERRPDGKGGYRITLPRDVLNKLRYVSEPGELQRRD